MTYRFDTEKAPPGLATTSTSPTKAPTELVAEASVVPVNNPFAGSYKVLSVAVCVPSVGLNVRPEVNWMAGKAAGVTLPAA